MGIALGYAFLLAIAGGLAAICLAYVLELAQDRETSGARVTGAGEAMLPQPADRPAPHMAERPPRWPTHHLSLTSK